ERKRCPERTAVPEPGEHLDGVGFDSLAWTAAVALLPASEVGVDRITLEHEAGGKAADDRDERGAVRLARGDEFERHQAERTAARMTSTGAGTPVHHSNEAAPCATRTSSPPTTRAPRLSASRAVAVAGYGRSTSVWPGSSSTRTSSRVEVAFTTRSTAARSGGHVLR